MLLTSTDPGRKLAFWFGLIASLAAGFFIDYSAGFGLDRGIATSLILVCITSIIWTVYQEKIKINAWSLALMLCGSVLGLVSGYFNTSMNVNIGTTHSFDVWIYLLNLGIIIPLFEELSVRRLMFLGASNWIGPWLSAIMVSLFFAWAHSGLFLFAFSISLLLCAATYRGVDTVNRSIFHGSYNLVVAVQLLHHAS